MHIYISVYLYMCIFYCKQTEYFWQFRLFAEVAYPLKTPFLLQRCNDDVSILLGLEPPFHT